MKSDADEIIGHYRRHGRTWDAARGKTLFEKPWLDRFLRFLPARSPILDMGCGSGDPIAAYFAQAGHPVTGIDSSDTLIALCRERFPDGDWHVADMRSLALGRRFAGLLAWDSFFHLDHDDQRAMFPVFRAHAAPDAALMFTSGPAHGVAIGEFAGERLYHASLDPQEYRALLDAQGFEVIAHVVEDPGCGGRTIWLARLRFQAEP
jgi:SAM-dependent methyltransferase